jgi:hypothetical protein
MFIDHAMHGEGMENLGTTSQIHGKETEPGKEKTSWMACADG